MKLSVLYRGALETCNYACTYCPFAKRPETPEKRIQDTESLQQFLDWVKREQQVQFSVFFTPWGEALPIPRYQQAIMELSHLPHVQKVVMQTNLSSRLSFLQDCQTEKLAFWCTYHPSQVSREKFLQQSRTLLETGVRFSVGVVGRPGHFAEIEALRAALPAEVYLWVNAYHKGHQMYPYTPEQVGFLTGIDPLFEQNTRQYPSRGKACFAGETVITVDEQGDIRRCHFVDQVLGNIHAPDWQEVLRPRACSRRFCDCHIGYVHLKELELYPVFEGGVLERIPAAFFRSP
ncbi:STM4011 family radical SAM protein [Deinococcus cellulosilyticus]|uniref:Membrane protein n=1 Tax=Deinococcus cellulosilyticus (strain DSM 18568 / NBRC 106333 / KACC 11606 / 5516J-15) TaxID=1223518 RepID=A0A511N4U8_DEIC1|nr:STM4011 family radical SAM protein [Deinococcus cellulosilyticus]GEM47498.1 membrane protein [Deinococcus cellulosilyticus NBRC 106333 = KACC 11606]